MHGVTLSGTLSLMTEQRTLNDAISEEIRSELGRRNISHADFARSCGWGKQYLHRRMTGQVPWSADELELVAKVLNLPIDQLTTAVRQ